MIPISVKELKMFRELIDYALWAEENGFPSCVITREELIDLRDRL